MASFLPGSLVMVQIPRLLLPLTLLNSSRPQSLGLASDFMEKTEVIGRQRSHTRTLTQHTPCIHPAACVCGCILLLPPCLCAGESPPLLTGPRSRSSAPQVSASSLSVSGFFGTCPPPFCVGSPSVTPSTLFVLLSKLAEPMELF